MLAEDYMRMGMVKAAKMEPLEPLPEEPSPAPCWWWAAESPASARRWKRPTAGYDVVLVEKAAAARRVSSTGLKKTFPTAPLTRKRSADGLARKLEAVGSNPRIKVLCSTKIVRTEGQPGMFDVTLEDASGDVGPARRRHRHGHRLEALRYGQARASLGYGLPERDHQRRAGTDGGTRANRPTLRWQAGQARAVRAVRRLPRAGTPAPTAPRSAA